MTKHSAAAHSEPPAASWPRRTGRRLLKGILAFALALVSGLAGLLTFLWFEHRRPLTLPAPTGAFAASRLMEVWTDPQRPDALAGGPGGPTELVVWIWYPSADASGKAAVEYLPADWQRAQRARQPRLFRLLMRDPSVIRPHSVADGTVAPEGRQYPVVILRAGLGAFTTQYTTLAEDLASHGYVVVGFDPPYRTGVVVFPDGRVVTRPPSLDPEAVNGEARTRLLTALVGAWVSDIGFVLDRLRHLNQSGASRLAGRLDLQKVGVVGHSLGGATTAQFCQQDPRCSAGIDMDGALLDTVVRTGLDRPFMFLLSDHSKSSDPADRKIVAAIQSVYDRLPSATRHRLTIRGADHFSFGEGLLVRSWWLLKVLRVQLEPRRALQIVSESVRRFLDVHLKAASGESLEALRKTYPELVAQHP